MIAMSPADSVRKLYEDAEERRRLAARLQGEASGLEEAAARLEGAEPKSKSASADVQQSAQKEHPGKMRRRRK